MIRRFAIPALILLAPFAFIAAMDRAFESVAKAESPWRVSLGQIMYSDVNTPDDISPTGWRAITFPYQLTADSTQPTSVWYRANVNAPEHREQLWSVYMGNPDGNYAVFVNGALIGESAPMKRPLPLYYEPLIFNFPSSLLQQGENRIDVHLVRAIPTSNQQAFSVGPASEIAAVHSTMHFAVVTIRAIMVTVLFVMSATTYTFFRLRTRDAALGWFALSLLIWALHLSIRLNASWPHGHPYFLDNLEKLTIGLYVLSAAMFVQRFVGIRYRSMDKAFATWALVGVAVLLLVPASYLHQVRFFYDTIWFPPLLLVGVFVNVLMLREYRKQANIESAFLFAVAWCELVVGTADQFVEMRLLPSRPYYLVYTAGLVALLFGFLLLRQFLRTLEAAERSRDHLELVVREKTRDLERNLVRIKDMERERALHVERERIAREMHDGLGEHLMQALSIVGQVPESQTLEDVLLQCWEELRLIVDSAESVDRDLATVLNTLHSRMERRLAAAGINVHWQTSDFPTTSRLGPERALQVTHIIHESIANVLKHANARNLTIRACLKDTVDATVNRATQVIIEVRDDGCGSRVQPSTSGRGLINMQHRAHQLGGELNISSGRIGTTVTLTIPV